MKKYRYFIYLVLINILILGGMYFLNQYQFSRKQKEYETHFDNHIYTTISLVKHINIMIHNKPTDEYIDLFKEELNSNLTSIENRLVLLEKDKNGYSYFPKEKQALYNHILYTIQLSKDICFNMMESLNKYESTTYDSDVDFNIWTDLYNYDRILEELYELYDNAYDSKEQYANYEPPLIEVHNLKIINNDKVEFKYKLFNEFKSVKVLNIVLFRNENEVVEELSYNITSLYTCETIIFDHLLTGEQYGIKFYTENEEELYSYTFRTAHAVTAEIINPEFIDGVLKFDLLVIDTDQTIKTVVVELVEDIPEPHSWFRYTNIIINDLNEGIEMPSLVIIENTYFKISVLVTYKWEDNDNEQIEEVLTEYRFFTGNYSN